MLSRGVGNGAVLLKSIYILNVVVKQAILIEHRKTKQATYCRVTYNRVPFITRYCIFIHVRTHLYIKVDNLKIIDKKVNVLQTSSLQRRHIQLCVSEDTGDMHIASHTVVPRAGPISTGPDHPSSGTTKIYKVYFGPRNCSRAMLMFV